MRLVASPQPMPTTRLMCTEDGAQKFWEGRVEGSSLIARWGRLGTAGQEKVKAFPDAAAAEKELDKVVREKRAKGYVDGGGTQGSGSSSGEGVDVVTDAGIVGLFDASHFGAINDQASWEAELLEDADIEKHIAAGHLVPLATGADGGYRVEVRVKGALSPTEEKKVAAKSEPYLLASRGNVFVGGIEYVHAAPDSKAAKAVDVATGRWSATVVQLDGGKKMPDVVVLLDEAKPGFAPRARLQPFEAKPKPAAKSGAPKAIKNLKQAGVVAVAGDIDAALPFYEAEAAKGVGAAWAVLAQIRGYRGDLAGALDAIARLLKDPSGIYAGNVTHEAKCFLVRIAHETGRWVDAAEAIAAQKPLREGCRDPVGDYIREQAEAGGKLALRPFRSTDDDHASLSLEERQAQYDGWMTRFDEESRKKKRKPGDREKAQFAYARSFGFDALALEVWPVVEPLQDWFHALPAARLFVRAGRPDDAWGVLERKIHHFYPVDAGQIAPIEPLADETLLPLMTPARLATLLAAPKAQDL